MGISMRTLLGTSGTSERSAPNDSDAARAAATFGAAPAMMAFSGLGGMLGSIPGVGGIVPSNPVVHGASPLPPSPGAAGTPHGASPVDRPPAPPPGRAFPADVIRGEVFNPPITWIPPIFIEPRDKTVTQIARGAIALLEGATRGTLDGALNAIGSTSDPPGKPITPDRLMRYLERRVAIGEVLNKLAQNWTEDTVGDFARAFGMDPGNRAVMDAIVSVSILNDPTLERDLRAENESEGTQEEFLGSRPVVWQHPPPGQPLEWPYVMLIAVDRQDFARRDEVVRSIVSALEVHNGFKLPHAAAQRLR